MTTSSGQSQAPLPQPAPGLLYRVNTTLLSGTDKKSQRPAVVIALPAYGLSDVRLLMRTTQLDVPGVPHAAHPELGLTKAGVFGFAYLRSLDLKIFQQPALVEYLGTLDPKTWDQIQQWWER